MYKRLLTYFLFCLIVVNIFAQPQLNIKKRKSGYIISRSVNNREIVLLRSDRGSFDKAIKSNKFFKQMVDTWNELPESKITKSMSYTLIDDGQGTPLPDYVSPLCTSQWEQYSEPYVWNTPLIDGEHCCVGCTPLALAQVLHYYKYPITGIGQHTYNDSLGCNQTLTANFSSHTYEYDYMLDSYDGINYSNRQGNAIAQLLSDCGIAINAIYGVGDTSGNPIYQTMALVDYFGYDSSDLQMYYRDFFTQSEWHSMLHRELAEGRPILISAWNYNNGHSFLIDGYDETGLYHVNWGLGGECNGYYNIDFMSPDQPQWNRFKDSPERGNNLIQLVTVGIKPKQNPQDITNSKTHVFAFSNISGREVEGHQNQFEIITNDLTNIGWNEYEGSVVLALCNSEGFVAELYNYEHPFDLHQLTNSVFSDTITVDLSSYNQSLVEGNYRIVPMFKEGESWLEARTMVGTPNYINASYSDGVWNLSQPQASARCITLSNMVFPETLYHRQAPNYSFSLTNNSESDYNGRIYIELYPLGVSDRTQVAYKQVALQGLYIKQGETQDLEFKYTPLQISPGEYTLHIWCDVDLFTDSLVEIYTSDNVIKVESTPTAVENIENDKSSSEMYYDLSGRKLSPADVRRQPIIMKKANKTRKVLRSDYQIQ